MLRSKGTVDLLRHGLLPQEFWDEEGLADRESGVDTLSGVASIGNFPCHHRSILELGRTSIQETTGLRKIPLRQIYLALLINRGDGWNIWKQWGWWFNCSFCRFLNFIFWFGMVAHTVFMFLLLVESGFRNWVIAVEAKHGYYEHCG